MIRCILLFFASVSLLKYALADIAPEITTVQDGYNIIAKIPCSGCPFLYQDTSKGSNEPWTQREDQNALLLNISLPYDAAFLSINNAAIYSGRSNLPRIYATQVLTDLSVADLATLISSNQLEASHETGIGGGFFGLSYRHSLRPIKDSPALILQFDIIELWSDLPETPISFKMDSRDQKMLELLLLERPLYSAFETPAFEMVKAELVARTHHPVAPTTPQQTMHFLDWDGFGRKGSVAHALTAFGASFLDFMDSGVWALFAFILAIIALFVVICIFLVFGWGFWQDDYEKAQHGKARGGKRRVRSDVESATRLPFKSAEELGFSRGRVVGLGKSD
ncbi:hypothetical protein K505DRAFT_404687 [Melanomma pulvis-pyrius CBS 109.77]|uniref:Uncharacterized protein n=1 Tax=Melanomma pulvis-pyrius CBS 109.77 TaxID=1314802 RepID=A0A6A6XSC5_9PLEO|nr:hypothetical protein K505DRAFT_404687 [Melanomma pulvis-pyrius CBS 109.77]